MQYLGKYKTYDGAAKRCRLENALAKSEFDLGYKARHYRYSIVLLCEPDGKETWRVKRELAEQAR